MENILIVIVIPLLLGFAASLFSMHVAKSYAVSVGIGSVVSATAVAIALYVPPYRVPTADWCIEAPATIRIEGTLGTLLFGSPVVNESVQVKVYRAGYGDPPAGGPTTVDTDVHGMFRAQLPALRLEAGQSYVLNIVYFYESVLFGQLWKKTDFKRGTPSSCAA